MPLRLYADECVNARVVAGLRRRGVDIATAADNGLLFPLRTSCTWSARITLGRAVITSDRDFLVIVEAAILIRGESFPGLIFIHSRARPLATRFEELPKLPKALDPGRHSGTRSSGYS